MFSSHSRWPFLDEDEIARDEIILQSREIREPVFGVFSIGAYATLFATRRRVAFAVEGAPAPLWEIPLARLRSLTIEARAIGRLLLEVHYRTEAGWDCRRFMADDRVRRRSPDRPKFEEWISNIERLLAEEKLL
jgi:hypothetical protein